MPRRRRTGAARAGRPRRDQALRRRAGPRCRRPRGPSRRGRRPPRRQRRRQVDPHQVHQRRPPPRRGRHRDGRRAGRPSTRPAQARALGIETVYQDLALFDNLGAGGQLLRRPRAGRADAGCRAACASCRQGAMARRDAPHLLDRLQVTLPSVDTPVGLMSGGQRQAVAVARAAAFASKVVILDEPTAALGVRESAAGPRPDHAAPHRRPRGPRHLARPRPRHRGRRSGDRHAAWPEGRRGGADRGQPASGSSR